LFGESRVRRDILALFFSRPGVVRHAGQLAREIGRVPQVVGRELARLEVAGVLTSEGVGRTRRYRVDERSPIAAELRTLVQKTVGLERRLSQALEDLPGIEEAFVYGSYAAGTDRPTSDVDVLVIGSVDVAEMARRVGDVERELDRDVNVHVYPRDEVRGLLEADDRFIRAVFDGPRIRLVRRPD
jgi:predicted nucleotidyltransferase